MMEPLTGRGWMARRDGTTIILFLRGDWTTREEAVRVTDLPLGAGHIETLRFDSSDLGRWDSSLLVFLSTLREVLRRRGILFDQTGLPTAACRLLSMLPAERPAGVVPARGAGKIERLGAWFLQGVSDLA